MANDQTMHERLTPSAPPGEGAPAPIRVQILATEHWSLLATRGMTYNEIFSRTGIFLTVVSASVVALALVAQATESGDGFYVFALLVLPVVLFLGLGTQLRVRDAVAEDVWLVLGMNRLRHAYLEMAPELEPYFVTSHHDDERGIMQNYGPWARVRPSRLLASTPVLVGVIDAVIAGVITGLVAEVVGRRRGGEHRDRHRGHARGARTPRLLRHARNPGAPHDVGSAFPAGRRRGGARAAERRSERVAVSCLGNRW